MSKALEDLQKGVGNTSDRNVPYLMFAQLMAIGYSFEEVWRFCHCTGETNKLKLQPQQNPLVYASKETSMGDVKVFGEAVRYLRTYIPVVNAADMAEQAIDPSLRASSSKKVHKFDITQKDSILRELQSRYEETGDTKLLAQAAELQRMKQEETKEEKRHIMHVLPARCNTCPCFKVAKQQYPDIKTLEP